MLKGYLHWAKNLPMTQIKSAHDVYLRSMQLMALHHVQPSTTSRISFCSLLFLLLSFHYEYSKSQLFDDQDMELKENQLDIVIEWLLYQWVRSMLSERSFTKMALKVGCWQMRACGLCNDSGVKALTFYFSMEM